MTTENILQEIRKSDRKIGNWASWVSHHKVSVCGWMDFHSDNGDGGASKNYRMFSIVPLYCHPDAWLVHKVNGKFVMDKPEIGKLITFDAYLNHALLPEAVGRKCVEQNSTRPSRSMMKWSGAGSTTDIEIRLLWKWISDLQ